MTHYMFEGHRDLVLLSLCLLLCYVPAALSEMPPSLGWGCTSCNQSDCPPVPCDESMQYVDGCGCCVLCGKLEGERCGGRGEAGGRCNDSSLRCAYRLGSIFGESRMGLCENERCRRKDCGYRERCKVVVEEDDGRVERLCTCDYFRCEHKWNLLCGRDGRNYASVCELQKAECLSGRPIGIQHFGKCKAVVYSSPSGHSCSRTAFVPHSHSWPTCCLYEDSWYHPLHIMPPTERDPCTYHVCSDGDMVPYPVPGCEGNPPEEDWRVDESVIPAAWSPWSPYSGCYGNCQVAGLKRRTRSCTNPLPSSNPEATWSVLKCEGVRSERVLCEPANCTICTYTPWTEWSHCSTTALCREGIRTRTRTLREEPTVRQLCVTRETKKCQLLACANCSRAWTDNFRVVGAWNGCESLYPQRAYVCGGSCGEGKCCRDVFRDNDRVPDLSFELSCRDRQVASFEQAGYCECRDCNDSNYDKPEYMNSGWKIIY